MKIGYYVIDDVQSDIDRLVREADKTRELECKGYYFSAYELLADFRKQMLPPAPIIFCDIKLCDENGLDAGPELAKNCKFLVYVTGLPQQQGHVLAARGDDHLQKPVTCDQIRMQVLDRFFKRHGDELPMRIRLNKLFITDKNVEYSVKLKDVLYVSHHRNYLTVATKNGKKFSVRDTVARAFSLLEPAGIFLKINRGDIINMKHAGDFDHTRVKVGDTSFVLEGEGKKAFKAFRRREGLGNEGNFGKSG